MAAEHAEVEVTTRLIEACQHERLGVIAVVLMWAGERGNGRDEVSVHNMALPDTPDLLHALERAKARGGNPVKSLN